MSLIVGFVTMQSCTKKSELSDNASQTLKLKRYSIETIEDKLNAFYSNNHTDKSAPGWWLRIKKWFKDHTGTYLFPNCGGNNPCGPCAGICFRSGGISTNVPDDYELTPDDRSQGIDLFSLTFISDSEAILSFASPVNFVYQNDFYLPSDYDFGGGVANAFSLKSVIAKSGIYAVSFANNPNGETVIAVEIIE